VTRIAAGISHTLRLHLHDLTDTVTLGEACKRCKLSLCDFHSSLLLHLQSGTSRAHSVSLTTVQTPYKNSETRDTPLCFRCSSSPLRLMISGSVGPCHHGMARPQVADATTASSMEGSCKYIVQAVADSRQEVVLLGGSARCRQLLTVKTYNVTKHSQRKPRTWTDPSVRPE
jgi:hypothetical protein